MRILYCNKYNFAFSGTETYLFAAMEMMRSRGHEAALFAMADSRGSPTALDRYFVSHKDFKTTTGFSARARLAAHAIYSVEARRKLRALIADFRPEIAHVRNIYHHLSPSILWELKAQGVPVLYHVNDFKLLCPSYNMVGDSGETCEKCAGGKFRNIVQSRCYNGGKAATLVLAAEAYIHRWIKTYHHCVDLILAPSEFVKHKFVVSGWDKSRIEVLPHFQNVPESIMRHPGRTGVISYFGRLSREKGIPDLLAAARQFPKLRFVIAGDGPMRQELQTLASDTTLQNVGFTGHISGASLDQLISNSQFTVFPSHAYETFGKSILESYAHARAVIASDLGPRRELVREGKTGLLYRAGDVDQLTAAIRSLSERPELAQQLGQTARRLVIEEYSPDEHFRALTSIYSELCKRRVTSALEPGNRAGPRVAFIGGRGIIGKYSGIESFYEEAGKRLAALGIPVTAYCRNYFSPANRSEHNGIRIVRFPTIRSKHLDTLVHTIFSTVHACFSGQDIIHFHTLGPSLFCWLPRLLGKKTVVSVQGLDWQRRKWSWFARLVLKTGEWASARLPNRTIVVSRVLQDYYRKRYAIEAAYIPNGTEIRHRIPAASLAKFDLKSGEYALFLGRFSPEKNCDMLVEAFERTNTPMKLVLAGGPSYTDNYVTDLRKHASERIRFLNWLSGAELEEVLTNAALFVLPSDMEGLSLALLDAMGAGVCVLASDVPENCEAIEDAGFTFHSGNRDHLGEMLSFLLHNEHLRREAGRKGQQRIQKNYLWDGVAQQLERV